MNGKAADRLRLAGIALGVAAVLVFAPLAVDVIWSNDEVDVDAAVVNMSNYPNFDDQKLHEELDESHADDVKRLIIIAPRQYGDVDFVCDSEKLPESCDYLNEAMDRTTTVHSEADPLGMLTAYSDPDSLTKYGNRVTTVRHDQGLGFGWRQALEVGLIMTIIAAGSLYFTARSVRWLSVLRSGVPDQFGVGARAPANSVPPQHAAGPPPGQQAAHSAPAPPAAAPHRRPPPRPAPPAPPGPLPSDVVRAVGVGRRVVAQTHFGPQGGFVDIGGVLIWARLDHPGEPVSPGRPLFVLALSTGSDSLVVSSRITEEVRQ
jgi:hypothetical protein